MSRHFPLAEQASSAIAFPNRAGTARPTRAKTAQTLPGYHYTKVNTHTDDGFWRSSTLKSKNLGKNVPRCNRTDRNSATLINDHDLGFSEEKEDLEVGVSITLGNPLQDPGEPSFSLQFDSDEDQMFSGDKDVKIAELTLSCAKMKQRYVAEKQTGTQLQQRIHDLTQSLENERKRYQRLEKNFSKKEQQILFAMEETTDLAQKLRKVSIEEPNSARKSKKVLLIPEDLKEFKIELKKVHGNKAKLGELALEIFHKYSDIRKIRNALEKSNADTRKKYSKLLYDCHELERWKQDMQKKYDLVKAQLEAITNEMEEAINIKLKPAKIEIENLKKELNEIRDSSQNQISLLRERNTQLRTKYDELQNEKNLAEEALQIQTSKSKVLADNLWIYKRQAEEHELTIRRWKCSLTKNIAYRCDRGKDQLTLVTNSENKVEPDTIDITLRLYKIPATGKLNIEISSDSADLAFADIRRELSEVRAVRQLFSEDGELSDLLSIIVGDQELLIQSWQAKEIDKALKAVLDIHNQVCIPESKESTPDRGNKFPFFTRTKETQTDVNHGSSNITGPLQQPKEDVPVSDQLKDFFFPLKKNTSEKE